MPLRGNFGGKAENGYAIYFLFYKILPRRIFLRFVLGWGLVGVWMAFPFGLTSAGVMLWLRFRYKTRTR